VGHDGEVHICVLFLGDIAGVALGARCAVRGLDHRRRRVDELRLLHILMFYAWMLSIENSPWPTLTLIVSLEAILLSRLVMIGQNQPAAFQQSKADHDFTEEELELTTNLQLTRESHTLTAELHKRYVANVAS